MPRNHNTGASTLRNRNRITNKTRLRILEGSIDADPLVLEEDEEKARVVSTAGVDAEDANVSLFLASGGKALRLVERHGCGEL
jgi:enhancer of polycomb-like protein